jgi:hypothetical protein
VIPIHRGTEPPELTKVRGQRLPMAIAAFSAHGPGSNALYDALVGYEVAKKALYLSQHRKCAYCERTPGYDGQPVEHFRPKKYAERRKKRGSVKDTERYWWLAWSWSNLLFACTTCNGKARKGNHFPLDDGSMLLTCPVRPAALPLPAACFDTASEHPLLLDPADDSSHPLDHLRWLPVDRTLAPRLWTWELRGKTKQGRATMRRLRLHDLADDVDGRYRETVWPRFHREVERRLGRTKPAQLVTAWNKLVRDLVEPSCPLTAATWSMLDVLRSSTQALRRAQLPAPPRP